MTKTVLPDLPVRQAMSPTPPPDRRFGPGMSALRVADLSYSVNGRTLLSQVCLDVDAGELVVIIGRNGAGKSTLIRHITGELGTARDVIVFSQALAEHRPAELARRRAVLTQNVSLSFDDVVDEIVLLGRIPHHRMTSVPVDRRIAAQCLARVGLAGYERRRYHSLSGGEQQRVQLARVLAQITATDVPRQRLLLLDEPTSSLDLAAQHLVLKLARELAAERVAVLAVLHDLNLAAQYANRILLLCQGRVLAYGEPGQVYCPNLLHTAFGHPVQVVPHPCLGCPLVVSAE